MFQSLVLQSGWLEQCCWLSTLKWTLCYLKMGMTHNYSLLSPMEYVYSTFYLLMCNHSSSLLWLIMLYHNIYFP